MRLQTQACAVALLLLGACTERTETGEAAPVAVKPPAAPTAPARDDRAVRDGLPNVVLVTMDTTRADYLGAYGRPDAHTENFDALAAGGLRFARAYSPVPLTIPAHSTLFTGLNPYHHGVRNNGDTVLGEEQVTLAERLWSSGYDTAASVAAFVTQRQWGLSQGFETYLDELPKVEGRDRNEWHLSRAGDLVVDDALGWLAQRDSERPYFLWVHLYDAHSPYKPPEAYKDIKDRYAAGLAYEDDVLGRLIAGVGDAPTLWVVAGDHGEARGNHYELTHGLFIYDATQHVPLVIKGPGVEPGVVDQPVGLVDVTPTVLSLLGLDVPAGLDGAPQPGNPHPLYMETHQLTDQYGYAHHYGIVDGDYKLVATPRPELYNVAEDDPEHVDLAAKEPGVVARLQAELAAMEVTPRVRPDESEIDPETLAQLAAMGYIGGADTPDGPLDDPKDHRDLIELLQRAILEQMAGAQEKETALLAQALVLEPGLQQPAIRLARLYTQQEELDKADATIELALERNPESGVVLENAIMLYLQQAKFDRAFELAQIGVTLKPDNGRFREFYVVSLLQKGDETEALDYGMAYLKAHPDASDIAAVMGLYFAESGRWPQSEPLLHVALKAEKPRRDIHRYLGVIAAATSHPEAALVQFQAELKAYPQNIPARALLSKLLGQLKDYDAELTQLDVLIRQVPDTPDYVQSRAMTLLNKGDAEGALAAAQAGLEKFGEHPGLQLMVANALGKLGRQEEAERAFEEAKRFKGEWVAKKAGTPTP